MFYYFIYTSVLYSYSLSLIVIECEISLHKYKTKTYSILLFYSNILNANVLLLFFTLLGVQMKRHQFLFFLIQNVLVLKCKHANRCSVV